MKNSGIKALLVAVVVLLILNLATHLSPGNARAQEPKGDKIVGIAAAAGMNLVLFRAFEDGRIEVSVSRKANEPAGPWTPWKVQATRPE